MTAHLRPAARAILSRLGIVAPAPDPRDVTIAELSRKVVALEAEIADTHHVLTNAGIADGTHVDARVILLVGEMKRGRELSTRLQTERTDALVRAAASDHALLTFIDLLPSLIPGLADRLADITDARRAAA